MMVETHQTHTFVHFCSEMVSGDSCMAPMFTTPELPSPTQYRSWAPGQRVPVGKRAGCWCPAGPFRGWQRKVWTPRCTTQTNFAPSDTCNLSHKVTNHSLTNTHTTHCHSTIRCFQRFQQRPAVARRNKVQVHFVWWQGTHHHHFSSQVEYHPLSCSYRRK